MLQHLAKDAKRGESQESCLCLLFGLAPDWLKTQHLCPYWLRLAKVTQNRQSEASLYRYKFYYIMAARA